MRRSFTAAGFLLLMAASAWHLRAQTAPDPERQVSWTSLMPNLAHDQKDIWLSAAKLHNRKYLWPTLAVVGAAAALVALDPKDAPPFRNTTAFNGFNSAFNSSATAWGTAAVPIALFSAGLVNGNKKMKNTALLAAEAVGDSEILTFILKDATNRTRPSAILSGQSYSDTWFEGRGSLLSNHGGFPSGHTIAAFSVATVVARRYGRQHKWIPYVAYGLAGAVGFSRISLSDHFVSDVFVGGALGYSISRFAVLHE